MKVVVRPNFDTLYSSAWLDLTKEPMIVSVPDTQGRYYLLPMLDMWTDVFARRAGAPLEPKPEIMRGAPGWSGRCRPAWFVSTRLRIRLDNRPHKTDGPADYEAVHQIQAGFKITPLSGWGRRLSRWRHR